MAHVGSLLRSLAAAAVALSAIGSMVSLLRFGSRAPLFLIALFVGWILSPFVALAWALAASGRWAARSRAAVAWTSLAVAALSLAIYGGAIPRPAGAPPAFLYVVGPALLWLLMAVVAGVVAISATPRRPAR